MLEFLQLARLHAMPSRRGVDNDMCGVIVTDDYSSQLVDCNCQRYLFH